MEEPRVRLSVSIPKRWLQLRLRTFLVVTCLLSVAVAYVGHRYAGNLPFSAPIGLEGYCPVTLCEDQVWQRGNVDYQQVYEGRRYLFVGREQRFRFRANPANFSPVASGIDVVLAVDEKRVVEGKREHGLRYAGKTFLFAAEDSLDKFWNAPDRYADYGQTLNSRHADRFTGR